MRYVLLAGLALWALTSSSSERVAAAPADRVESACGAIRAEWSGKVPSSEKLAAAIANGLQAEVSGKVTAQNLRWLVDARYYERFCN